MKTSLLVGHFKIGNQLLREKKFDQAVQAYSRAVRISPHFESYCNLGIALKNLGFLDEALVAYKRAIKLKPRRAETYNNLGNVYSAAGDIDNAVKNYHRAINISPNYVSAYENLIELYLSLKKTKKAVGLQKQVNKIIHKKNLAWSHLGGK